jgi:hypothetical protein
MDNEENLILKFVCIVISYVVVLVLVGTVKTTFDALRDQKNKPNAFSDSDLGWNLLNYKGYNDCGLRDDLTCADIKNIKKKKFIFLGNSIVAGLAVEPDQTFPKIFQKKSNDYYVSNGGNDGYEIHREFLKFKRDLADLNFNYVFWFINRNDLMHKSEIQNIIKKTKDAQNVNEETHFWPLYLHNLKKGVFLKNLNNRFISVSETWVDGPKDHYYADGILTEPDLALFEEMMSEVNSFNSFLVSKNIKMYVVFLPDRAFSKFYSWNDATFYKKVASALDQNQIPWISLLNEFPKDKKNYYLDSAHFNVLGHAVIGNLLYEKIQPLIN